MNSKHTRLIIIGLCIVASLLVAGCTQQTTPVQTQTITPTIIVTASPTSVGIANPASVYCVNVGGTLEIMKDTAGNEYGMCNFSNGTSCEEWALYRSEGCKPNVAPATSPVK